MTKKNIIKRVSLTAALAITVSCAYAQDIHFTQFNATPLTLNPAFTGAFEGPIRASAIYRDQWRSVVGSAAYRTFAVSVDAPVKNLNGDDYLAAGIQIYNDVAGDGNLNNFSGLLSVAYHKFLGIEGDKTLSIGLQGGYTSKSIDLSKLYFGSDALYLGSHGTQLDGSPVRYVTVNAGIGYSQKINDQVSFTLGVAGNNLNQPRETILKSKHSDVGLGMRLAAQAGAVIYTGERFSFRPAVLYQTQTATTEIIAGNEFNCIIASDPEVRDLATSLFVGGWYRNNDAVMISGGIEHRGFRVGVAYDYNTSALKTASSGKGGFEIMFRYIGLKPLNAARNLVYPCSRF
ncbi:MAG: PorP/SprF family type IX secretion system membrane protein [Phycisphaerales bacterium]|nr:PorP/SprF family type IX secretion system membrane protein [Phycisphaerales bacterium]